MSSMSWEKQKGLNYACDYREFNGIKVPKTRRVVGFDENKRKIPKPVLVAIDIRELAFSSGPSVAASEVLPDALVK